MRIGTIAAVFLAGVVGGVLMAAQAPQPSGNRRSASPALAAYS